MGIKKPGNYTSPLAPGIGGQPQTALSARYPSASPNPPAGGQVLRGNAKDPNADPSVGTAIPRAADFERTGARYRLRTEFSPVAPVTHESAAATQANTPFIQDVQRPNDGSVSHGAGTNAEFSQHVAITRDGESAPGLR